MVSAATVYTQSQLTSFSLQNSSGGRTKQTARKSLGLNRSVSMSMGTVDMDHEEIDFSSEESYSNDKEDEQYRLRAKQPMEAKQSLLHLASTEIIVNTRLHGELSCFRTTFDSWNSLLSHQTIFAVLEFMDDAEPRLRRRGMPGSHALSDTLGETVLFCLDFGINQATEGTDSYRLGDEIWFWNKDYNKCASAWANILKFTEVMGVKVSLYCSLLVSNRTNST
jgi:hypothetical protein